MRDGVVAVLVGDDFGFLVEAADAEDGALRLVDDRGAELLAEDAGVGEGEGATGDLVGSELLAAGAVGYVDDGAGDAEEVLLFRLLDDGDDEAPVERDGDADVDVLVVADGVAFDRAIDDGVLAQRDDGGARDERHVGELDAVALLVLRLLLFAELDDARHVHLEDGVDVRAGALRLDHALRDDGAHLRHRDEFAGLRLRCGGLGCGRRGSCRGGRGGSRSRRLRALLQVTDNIGLRDAAGGSGARDLGQVDVVVLRDLADQRRGADALAFGGSGRCAERQVRAAAGAAAAGAAAGAGAAAFPAAPPMTATTVLMVTVEPSGTLISERTPATGEGISASTLSVEISKMGSSRWTVSPTFLSHLVMVPSVMDSPICGIRTSVPGQLRRLPAAAGCPGSRQVSSTAAGVTLSAAGAAAVSAFAGEAAVLELPILSQPRR